MVVLWQQFLLLPFLLTVHLTRSLSWGFREIGQCFHRSTHTCHFKILPCGESWTLKQALKVKLHHMLLQANLNRQPGTEMGRWRPCSAGPDPGALPPWWFSSPWVTAGAAGPCTSQPGSGSKRHHLLRAWQHLLQPGQLPSRPGKICGSCQPFPVPSWQPPSATALLVSPGWQGCHVCPGTGHWAANCTAHMPVPHTLLHCNLVTLPGSSDSLRLCSQTRAFRTSVLQKSPLSLLCLRM